MWKRATGHLWYLHLRIATTFSIFTCMMILNMFRLCRCSSTFFYFNYIVTFGILICFDIKEFEFEFEFWCFNATFSNISAISLRPVLVAEEARENHRPGQATGKLYHLRLRVECTIFVIYKAGREPTLYWW